MGHKVGDVLAKGVGDVLAEAFQGLSTGHQGLHGKANKCNLGASTAQAKQGWFDLTRCFVRLPLQARTVAFSALIWHLSRRWFVASQPCGEVLTEQKAMTAGSSHPDFALHMAS